MFVLFQNLVVSFFVCLFVDWFVFLIKISPKAIEVETGSEIYEPASVSIEIDVDWISSPFLSTPSSPSTPSSSPSSPSSTSSVSPLSSFQNAVKKQKTVKMEPFENINTINSDWGEKGLQEELEELKTSFDNVNERAYRRARDRANPFEYLKVIFLFLTFLL